MSATFEGNCHCISDGIDFFDHDDVKRANAQVIDEQILTKPQFSLLMSIGEPVR